MTPLGSYLFPDYGTAGKHTGFIFLSHLSSLRELGFSPHIVYKRKTEQFKLSTGESLLTEHTERTKATLRPESVSCSEIQGENWTAGHALL